jgi:hypothetical protein
MLQGWTAVHPNRLSAKLFPPGGSKSLFADSPPQAPLLISIIDSLSARWVEVLQPGAGYTGCVGRLGVGIDGPYSPAVSMGAQIVADALVRLVRQLRRRTGDYDDQLEAIVLGMKSAACWFAPRWHVRTTALGEPVERARRAQLL